MGVRLVPSAAVESTAMTPAEAARAQPARTAPRANFVGEALESFFRNRQVPLRRGDRGKFGSKRQWQTHERAMHFRGRRDIVIR